MTVRRSQRLASIKDEISVVEGKAKPQVKADAKVTKPQTKAKPQAKAKAQVKPSSDAILVPDELEVGDMIPADVEVTFQNGEKVSLLEYAKESGKLVIFAYPRASTPGCTRQARGFRDEYEKLQKEGAEVVGLSADGVTAQLKFKERQELPFNLICDVDKELISMLGCKKYPSGIIRSHFVFVDGEMKVKNVKVSPEASYQKALEQVQSIII